MGDFVKIEIEVTPEAAAALADEDRRRRVGAMVSRMVRPRGLDDPLLAIFRETQVAARRAGLSEQDIDDELAAYDAEGRR
jgi:hypothetical protein